MSFIVTGASASGKTTLVQEAISQGFNCLPTVMTRPLRKGEIDGVHAKFMSEQEFKIRFDEGDFLEDSLDYAKVHATGIYYGTPRAWIPKLEEGKNVAMPVAPLIARKLMGKIATLQWVHLICNDEDRYQRLKARNISDSEIDARMNSGDSIEIPEEADIYNSSILSVDQIMSIINKRRGIN